MRIGERGAFHGGSFLGTWEQANLHGHQRHIQYPVHIAIESVRSLTYVSTQLADDLGHVAQPHRGAVAVAPHNRRAFGGGAPWSLSLICQ